MIYTSFSLNGAWEMGYQEEKYTEEKEPFQSLQKEEDAAGTEPESICNDRIEKAVPGYWEDMTEAFQLTSFYGKLKINPEYGIQRYPIAGNVPDMALPNIVGTFFYRRTFYWEKSPKRAVLHFEGVQNCVSVWINDRFIGMHEGYSTPFELGIPEQVMQEGDNKITLSVSNHRLLGQGGEMISGLTSRAANECTGGITGDVEIREYLSALRDAVVRISEDCNKVNVELVTMEEAECSWEVCDGSKILKKGKSRGCFSFDTEGLEYWSPENPRQYTLKIVCGKGELVRCLGIRSFRVDGVHFRLNNTPYYLRGICEHGYYPQTVHPDHDRLFYRKVIQKVKNLGFNFIRFHTYIPEEEYMQAADELGMLLHVECPNNTTVSEWEQIIKFCRRHPSVVIYCCGNELLMDEPFIAYLKECAAIVHQYTDALFSPMSALRGLEYFFVEPDRECELQEQPFRHHSRRFEEVSAFSDLFSSYANGQHSYFSLDTDPETVDSWSCVYNKPRVSHEICIDGTYVNLELKDRYAGTRIGNTEMFSSIERQLKKKSILQKAPLYFQNSCEWQRRIRKFCFEAVRRCKNIAGYDFLGPIDTHWHTFGYDVGMMNEFYELKSGETVRNVQMYNAPTVLLNDLGTKTNFVPGERLACKILVSHYARKDLVCAELIIRIRIEGKVVIRQSVTVDRIRNGEVSDICHFSCKLPTVQKPVQMKMSVTLDGDEVFTENEWELYLFPTAQPIDPGEITVSYGMQIQELIGLLRDGRKVLLLGTQPFQGIPVGFRIALAGRSSGNLATVIKDHPVLWDMPHEGFCGWQFAGLLEGANAVCFEADQVVFDPIVEVVSTHKYVIRQAAMFEFCAGKGSLFVCSFHFGKEDPAAQWLLHQIITYMKSESFQPENTIEEAGLYRLANSKVIRTEGNSNLAFNPNDKTANRKKRR